MKKLTLLLVILFWHLPGYTFALTQDIHIEWSHDYHPIEGRELAGYNLYKDGTKVCTSTTPEQKIMDCSFESEYGTYDFTLTAFCTDNSESPHSAPYTFTLAAPTEPLPFNIHLEWTHQYEPIEGKELAGYRLYQEGEEICTSSTISGNNMDCTFETLPGTYDFTLTAYCSDGTESPHSPPYTLTLIKPEEPALIAHITTNPTVLSGDAPYTISFDGSASSGNITEYVWDFGDNHTATGSQVNHTYTIPGTHHASLSITNATGKTSQANITLTVTQPPLAAIATTPTQLTGDTPFTVSFDATPSTGNIVSYKWNFGDGTTGNGSQINHTYTAAGTFPAILTVTSSNGTTNQKSVNVTVSTPPVASINTSPATLSGDAPFTVLFDGTQSTGNIAAYNWDFGDGTTGNGSQTNHTYTAEGSFPAKLTVTSTNGTVSQQSVNVTVSAPPVASIIANPSTLSGEAPFTVSFNGTQSTGNIAAYNWDFGDGTTGNGSQTNHTYTAEGSFPAKLTVTSANGTVSQQSVNITASAPPVASINTSPSTLSGDIPFTVSFNGTSSTGDITEYNWDFGDSTTGSGSSVNHTYNTEGVYTALLTVRSSYGTTSTKSVTITATKPEPVIETFDINLQWSYDYQPIEGKTLEGYHLYKEGTRICTTNTPENRAMDCSFESLPGTYEFTLTAYCTEGDESPHSAPYSFTLSSTSDNEFAANIITTPAELTGEAPFTVQFDGGSSPGAITYQWMFGDGEAAAESLTEHTYTSAGTYTAVLSVTGADGQVNSKSTTVVVNESTTENTPPIAVINSSTAMGDAPLSVTFSGEESTDDGEINTFLWNFGDGSATVTGPTSSHIYLTAGTYSASLTVTDDKGASSASSTPVIITGQTVENQNPIPNISTSEAEGNAPLTVTFDASASSDPENSPLSYNWNFGDGTTSQGEIVEHTFTLQGSFTVTLTVTDNMGASAQTTTIINTDPAPETFKIELGEVTINHEWAHVEISESFTNPIVVAGPPSYNGSHPCVIRLRNITPAGFDIRIQEWDYLDGTHTNETVAYLVLEQGSFTLEDGTKVEAGLFEATDTNFKTVVFNTRFNTEPVVMTSIASYNEENVVTARIRNISITSFEHKTQEQESLSDGHAAETVYFVAWQASATDMGSFSTIVNKTSNSVTNNWYTINHDNELPSIPIFLGTMQTSDGGDTAAIRYRDKTTRSIQVMIEEEQSANSEIGHTSEEIGYFLFYAN